MADADYELLRTQLRAHAAQMRALEARLTSDELRLERAEDRLDEHEDAIVDDRKARMTFAAVVEDLRAELARMTSHAEAISRPAHTDTKQTAAAHDASADACLKGSP